MFDKVRVILVVLGQVI